MIGEEELTNFNGTGNVYSRTMNVRLPYVQLSGKRYDDLALNTMPT